MKQFLSGEKGQALLMVLGLLAIGGLTIAVSLNYATTNLKGNRIIEEKTAGIYAAGAGIEYALWSLQEGLWSPPEDETTANATPENISGMSVSILAENQGIFSLYFGDLIEPSVHVNYLDVDGDLVWDEGAQAYKYTVTLTWQPEHGSPKIGLREVGARIPAGYSYQSGSAAMFPENFSTDEPDETLDAGGAYLLNWEFGTPRPEVSEDEPVGTQTFYITGTGGLVGDYAWAKAQSGAIGMVGEITGTRYKVTATATRPEDGTTSAEIVAGVIIVSGDIQIMSWQITK